MKFKHLTAPVYWSLFPSDILGLEIREEKATCESCLMARSPTPVEKRYQDHLKCCTFYPYIPNFAVGAVLKDSSDRYEEVQEVLRKMIHQRQYVLPIGMVAPWAYQKAFKKRKDGEFGQREDWLCPYFSKQKNQCSMWAYRGAVCTSFYCKSSYAQRGKKFWNQVSDYLTFAEMALMEEALIRLDFSPRQISDNLVYINREGSLPGEGTGWKLPSKVYKSLWRDYGADVEGFYIKCFDIVSGFDKASFREMMGEQGLHLQSEVIRSWENL